jgi:hypothetical protein
MNGASMKLWEERRTILQKLNNADIDPHEAKMLRGQLIEITAQITKMHQKKGKR